MLFVLLFLFALPLFSLLSHASEGRAIELSAEPLVDVIYAHEQASYRLSIKNNGRLNGTFRISFTDVAWSVQSDPLYDYFSGMSINVGETKDTTLFIKPINQEVYGKYKIEVVVQSKETGIKESEILILTIRPPKPTIREYLAVVRRLVDIPPQVDPREPMPIGINLENRNPMNISSLTIILRSNLIDNKVSVSLGPLESKRVEITESIPSDTPPQADTLNVSFVVGNETLEPVISEVFEVMGYSDVKARIGGAVKRPFFSEESVTYLNDGNKATDYYVEQQISMISSLFTRTSPKAFSIKREGAYYLAWRIRLEPHQSVTITVRQDYRALGFALFFVIIVIVGFFFIRKPVSVKKSASVFSSREGGISEMKVVIHIRNLSGRGFERVVVIDPVPDIAEVDMYTELGTLQPSKVVKHPRKGKVVKWSVGSLERFEERILTYKLKSRLSILGELKLEPARVKYVDDRGVEILVRSNSVRLSA